MPFYRTLRRPGLPLLPILLAGLASPLNAGGVGLSGQPVDILFEEGSYARLSFGIVSPDVSGIQVTPFAGGEPGDRSGDMTSDLNQVSASYKHAFPNGLEAAIIVDEPFGADVAYPGGRGYFMSGTTAELESSALTGLLKYRFDNNVSVYGGLRYQRLEARAMIPFMGYTAEGSRNDGVGYVAGISYEVPEIALRLSATYSSQITHELDTRETSPRGVTTSTTEIDAPRSLNLRFQTGIAADTLLFGSARWVEWSEFDISPTEYAALTGGGSLVFYPEDRVSYSLGLGRQITEAFAGAVTVGYEPEQNNLVDNLGPVDGSISLTLGGTYEIGRASISVGLSRVWIGNARARGLGDTVAAEFDDNTATGLGVQVGYSF